MEREKVNQQINKNKKKKLYFLIDSDLHTYFFENELKHMIEKYDVTVLSANEITGNISIKDLDIRRVDNNFKSFFERITAVFDIITSVTLYKEIADILRCGNDIFARIKDSLAFFIQSEKYYAGLKRTSLIDEKGKGIIYCYWYNFTPLAIVNHREYKNYHVITRTHGYELYDIRNEFGRQPFKMLMDKRLEKVVFACEYAKEYYLKRYNLEDSEKYQVCALGTLDNTVIKRQSSVNEQLNDGNDKRVHTIVSCSDLVPLKRVELIAMGLSQIDDICIKWVHFGSGRELQRVEKLISNLLNNKTNIEVELKGRVKNQELHRFYNENEIALFITTTATEGGNPVSIMEAMSHSIPIVATGVCNIPKMINGNGVVMSENPDEEEIAKGIRDIITADKEKIQKMRTCSRKLWEEKYNSDVNSDMFIETVLEKL